MYVGDSLTNLVAGMGTDKDKVSQGTFRVKYLTKPELDALYQNEWIAGTIVDAPCDDMTREWREWKAGPRKLQAIETVERRFRVRASVNHALKLARLYGGSAILIGTGDERPDLELDPASVKKDGLKYLHVLSRFEIFAGEIDRDPTSLHFGEPSFYQLATPTNGATVHIHPSRVVRFLGQARLELSQSIDGWGLSTLQRVYDAVRHAAGSAANLASLTYEAKLDVIKLKNLTQNVQNTDYQRKIIARFGLANMAKSINNALILDAEEEWDQKQISFSQFPEILRLYIEVAAGAGNLPVTRLLGSTPGGLNNNNEGSLRHYYDTLSSRQEVELRPGLERLDEIVIRSALGSRPADVWYEFKPLWQLTDAEKAAVALQKAQATEIIAALGVMPRQALIKAVQSQLTEDGTYPGLEGILEETAGQPPEPLIVKKAAVAPGKVGQSVAGSKDAALADAAPRSLYVSRAVVNKDQILAWARKQGFGSVVADLHVTVAFSRTEVDWFKTGEPWGTEKLIINSGGPRMMERFGDAVVLLFSSYDLRWRWESFREAGCSWDHEDYQPHITITYDGADVDLGKVEPYTGPIVLGPEIYAEVDDDWKAGVVEKSTG